VSVAIEQKRELTEACIQSATIEQLAAVREVLFGSDRNVTLARLAEETSKLTDTIQELLNEGDLTKAEKLIEQKLTIASILHDTATDGFARRVEDGFVFRLEGPGDARKLEADIVQRLGADNAKPLIEGLRKIGVDISKSTPELSQAILRTDGTFEIISGDSPHDARQGVALAVEAVCQAKEAGVELKGLPSDKGSWEVRSARVKEEALGKGLSEGTAVLLEKLADGQGEITINGSNSSGVLHIYSDGRLVAEGSGGYAVA